MDKTQKAERYFRIYGQLMDLFKKSSDPIARMATVAAILHHKFEYYFWTGFYGYSNEKLTILCYQGTLACLVLTPHTGVCWTAVDRKTTQIVPDVNDFPGHIACDSRSVSEIVIPVYDTQGNIAAVLDIDSREHDVFDEVDCEWLEKIAGLIY